MTPANREAQCLGYTLQSDKKTEPQKILVIIEDDKDSQMSRLICYLCLEGLPRPSSSLFGN